MAGAVGGRRRGRGGRRGRGRRRCRRRRGRRGGLVLRGRGADEEDEDRDREQERGRGGEPRDLLPVDHHPGDGPDLACEPLRLRARGAAPVLVALLRREHDGARDGHERARRAARERARDVGRRRALRADAREQEDRLRHQPPRLADRARMRRADDRAHAREAVLADELLAPLLHERRHLLPERAPVRERQVLDVRAARVRRLHEAEDPGAGAAARLQERLDGVGAEVRVHRERVGRPGLEVGGRVRARGRADVPALAVGDHEQAGPPRVPADVLERAHALGAVRLEERELRLHGDDVRRDRVDEPAAEARDRAGGVGVAPQLDREQLDPRVEPDDDLRPLPLDGLGEPVGEGRGGHGLELLRHRAQG